MFLIREPLTFKKKTNQEIVLTHVQVEVLVAAAEIIDVDNLSKKKHVSDEWKEFPNL